MSFAASSTYIYAYVAFACVYLAGSVVMATSALKSSSVLSRSTVANTSALDHGRRVLTYTHAATVLPLAYIVGSVALGSVIARNPASARGFNIIWIAFTSICAAAAIVLAVMALREWTGLRAAPTAPGGQRTDTPDAIHKVGLRLGVSTALLLLVAVFTLLNVWSVLTDIGALKAVDFLL